MMAAGRMRQRHMFCTGRNEAAHSAMGERFGETERI